MNNSTFWKVRSPLKRKKTSSPAYQLGREGRGGTNSFWKFYSQTGTGLVHWIGSHLIRETLGTSSLKEGAAGVVGD
jgi:hypothetical protein